ncbi:MAG: type II toxin-antitoxin system HicA family toxin [Mesorhizobium sp.]|nr:type II toxin-antitoxin system HicA family toxin [Mesorhizobium sp.]
MPRLPVVTGRVVLKALERGGFVVVRIKGSHHFMRHPGTSKGVPVPIHGNRDIPAGLLKAILAEAGLSVDEFIALL